MLEKQLGWRVARPTSEELQSATDAGLHPQGSEGQQPFCLLPFSHPISRDDKRISGPLWTGPLFDQDALASMTVERAIALCGDDAEPAVRHWVGEAELASVPSLIITDMLPKFCEVTGPPKIADLIEGLKAVGYKAAVCLLYTSPSPRD